MGLRISPSAADFIRRKFETEPVEKVLVVTGFVVGSLRQLEGDDWDNRPLHDLEQTARKAVGELPSKVMIEYSIGTKELDKVPREYVRVVDGIKCCLPDDLIETIGDREIVLDEGVLRFEPALEPFELKRG